MGVNGLRLIGVMSRQSAPVQVNDCTVAVSRLTLPALANHQQLLSTAYFSDLPQWQWILTYLMCLRYQCESLVNLLHNSCFDISLFLSWLCVSVFVIDHTPTIKPFIRIFFTTWQWKISFYELIVCTDNFPATLQYIVINLKWFGEVEVWRHASVSLLKWMEVAEMFSCRKDCGDESRARKTYCCSDVFGHRLAT